MESIQVLKKKKDQQQFCKTYEIPIPYFLLLFVSVVWKTLEADMRFSIYCSRTWFSDFSFRFSSLTASTLADRSISKIKKWIINKVMTMTPYYIPLIKIYSEIPQSLNFLFLNSDYFRCKQSKLSTNQEPKFLKRDFILD